MTEYFTNLIELLIDYYVAAVFDPSIAAYEATGARFTASRKLVGSKKKIEFVTTANANGGAAGLLNRDVMYFPGCNKDGAGDDAKFDGRTLGQIASTVYFVDPVRERAFKDFWRSSVVFSRDVFQVAARIIATLGLWQFSALHIRRNDLQVRRYCRTSRCK